MLYEALVYARKNGSCQLQLYVNKHEAKYILLIVQHLLLFCSLLIAFVLKLKI